MKVILLQTVPGLGNPGDVKEVRNGYGRNFLLPRALALPGTDANLQRRERLMTEARTSEEHERASRKRLAQKLAAAELRFVLKMGPRGKAFGSVSAEDVAEALAKQGIKVEKNWIQLEEPIKTAGEHIVQIKMPHQVAAELKIRVEAAA